MEVPTDALTVAHLIDLLTGLPAETPVMATRHHEDGSDVVWADETLVDIHDGIVHIGVH